MTVAAGVARIGRPLARAVRLLARIRRASRRSCTVVVARIAGRQFVARNRLTVAVGRMKTIAVARMNLLAGLGIQLGRLRIHRRLVGRRSLAAQRLPVVVGNRLTEPARCMSRRTGLRTGWLAAGSLLTVAVERRTLVAGARWPKLGVGRSLPRTSARLRRTIRSWPTVVVGIAAVVAAGMSWWMGRPLMRPID